MLEIKVESGIEFYEVENVVLAVKGEQLAINVVAGETWYMKGAAVKPINETAVWEVFNSKTARAPIFKGTVEQIIAKVKAQRQPKSPVICDNVRKAYAAFAAGK